MPRLKPNACINCKEVPAIRKTNEEDWSEGFEYVLMHVKNSCYPTFKLMTFQNTRHECIRVWNKFNAK